VELEGRVPPGRHHVFHLLVEDRAAVGERCAERRVLALIVAAPRREHRAPPAQEIEQVELLDHPERMIDRKHDGRGTKLEVLGAIGDVGQEHRR
jgi:hypothetical protein